MEEIDNQLQELGSTENNQVEIENNQPEVEIQNNDSKQTIENNFIDMTVNSTYLDEDFSKADFSIEKKNYSKLSYKKLERYRVDGVAFGIKIPVLQQDLIKPKKKRTPFIVFGILSSILLALASILAVMVASSTIMMALESTGSISGLSNSIISIISLGFVDLVGGLFSGLIWGIVAIVLMVVGSIVYFFIYFTRTYFNMSRYSIQEMAVGYETRDLLVNNISLVIISALAVGGMTYLLFIATKIVFGLILTYIILIAVLLYTITTLVFLIIEKKKAKELFAQLPLDAQENFKEHTNCISRVKRKMKRMRDSKDANDFNFF